MKSEAPATSHKILFVIHLQQMPRLFRLHNKTISSIALQTAPGCLGECAYFRMLTFRTGALKFTGLANIEPMGENVGAVNFYQFGNIASVVETPGFLELPDQERDGAMSTVGNTILEIEFSDGSVRTISRDGLFEPPIFWAVAKLTESMLELVKWGQKEYDETIEQFTAEYGG